MEVLRGSSGDNYFWHHEEHGDHEGNSEGLEFLFMSFMVKILISK